MSFERFNQSYELNKLSNDELTNRIKEILKVEVLDLDVGKLEALAEKISTEAREFKRNPKNIGSPKATRYPFISRQWNSQRREFENSITSIQALTDFVINMAVKEFKPNPTLDIDGVDQGVWKFKN